MDKLTEIKGKIEEFNRYIEGIDLTDLKENYTRKELEEFARTIYKMNSPSIAYNVSNLTKAMKIEEYPQLLGVHHFPIVRNIPFLTEEEKVGLDQFLVRMRVGNYVSGLWRIVDRGKVGKLENWLEENNVIGKHYAVICPHCYEDTLTIITADEKKKIDELDREKSYIFLHEKIGTVCMECEREVEIEDMGNIEYRTIYKMKMERDDSLDHV